VARLNPESKVQQGAEAELWVNATKLHLFDAETGRSHTSKQAATAPATG
jgi:hypothetical protein